MRRTDKYLAARLSRAKGYARRLGISALDNWQLSSYNPGDVSRVAIVDADPNPPYGESHVYPHHGHTDDRAALDAYLDGINDALWHLIDLPNPGEIQAEPYRSGDTD